MIIFFNIILKIDIELIISYLLELIELESYFILIYYNMLLFVVNDKMYIYGIKNCLIFNCVNNNNMWRLIDKIV